MSSTSKPLKMYNLNVNVATSLAVGGAGVTGLFDCNTPRTPEILNSLIAMTNPFEALGKNARENTSPGSDTGRSSTASPIGSQTTSPQSIQHTCSQLIKEGLKLTLQSKRKLSGSDSKDEDDPQIKRTKSDQLTVEDEERRKRRRERNKIAATKCRMKKREKTANLVTESEILEKQNNEMKIQIQDLERQSRSLEEMLNTHACVRRQTPAQMPSSAQTMPLPTSTYEVYHAPVHFVDPDFGDETALISYNKDPNFGKLMDGYFPPTQSKGKLDGEERSGGGGGNFFCADEDGGDGEISMRSSSGLDASYFSHNDSGYSSFSTTSLNHGCRA